MFCPGSGTKQAQPAVMLYRSWLPSRGAAADESPTDWISIKYRQQWIFHQAEKELTTLPGLRYSSGHKKGRLKILSI
jgi:hypothetical protein